MHADFITLLQSADPVTDLATGGITWQGAAQAPASNAPYVVLTRVGGAIGMNHGGRTQLDTARVQVDCYAPSFAQAAALREAVLTSACGKPGVVGDTDFTAILPNSPRDFEPVAGLHRCLADLSVTHRPAA